MYQPFLNGTCDHPGFSDPGKAKNYLSRYLVEHRVIRSALVVGYTVKSADGMRSEYYDWTSNAWIRSKADAFGATLLARQSSK